MMINSIKYIYWETFRNSRYAEHAVDKCIKF